MMVRRSICFGLGIIAYTAIIRIAEAMIWTVPGTTATQAQPSDDAAPHNPVSPRRGVSHGGYRSSAIIFVDAAAAPGGDGSSWDLAYQDLQQALADAQFDSSVMEIRVAAGIYKPDAGTGDRNAAFLLTGQSDLTLLGGFPSGGGELEDRDPGAHLTVLSGDLAGNDIVTFEMLTFNGSLQPDNLASAGVNFESIDDNTYTVVSANGADETVTIDGFVISGGHAPDVGGGLVASNSGLQICNIIFRDNSAGTRGGAAYLTYATAPILIHSCQFERNTASSQGGALYVEHARLMVSEVIARENVSARGGWLYLYFNDGEPHGLSDFTLERNFATIEGGALYAYSDNSLLMTHGLIRGNAAASDSGGVSLHDDNVIASCDFIENVAGRDGAGLHVNRLNTIRDCQFTDNIAGSNGAGAYAHGYSTVVTCGFTRNSALTHGGGMYDAQGRSTISRCRFDSNHGSRGAGLHLHSTSSRVTATIFSFNIGATRGGGVYSGGGNRFDECEFVGNASETGGGAYALSNFDRFNDCVFEENIATGDGGGFWGDNSNHQFHRCQFLRNIAGAAGGGVRVLHTGVITDSIFIGNQAGTLGGGMYARGAFGSSVATSTFVANDAQEGGGIYAAGPLTISDSLLWSNVDTTSPLERAQLAGNTHIVDHCIVMGLDQYSGSDNLGDDPLLVDETGPDMVPGSGDEDLRLTSASPAIDAGSRSGMVTNIGPFDAYGSPRYVGFDGAPSPIVDIGALEAQDCNADGFIDTESIALGYANDCNEDGVPDACQAGSFVPTEQVQLVAQDSAIQDLGTSLAIRNNMIIAGAPLTNYNGAVETGVCVLFDADSGQQLTLLAPPVGTIARRFGADLTWTEQYLAVGAESGIGSAYLYDSESLTFLRAFVPLDGTNGHHFGSSIALVGSTLIVGAPGDDQDSLSDSGSVYLFDCESGSLLHKLRPLEPGSDHDFGFSIDAEGDRVLVGSPGDNFNDGLPGFAYLFSVSTGQQLIELVPSHAAVHDRFGAAVSLTNGRAFVSAPSQTVTDPDAGAVFVFDASTGAHLARIVAPDSMRSDQFGTALAVDSGLIAVGATGVDGAFSDVGAVYLFDEASFDFIAKVQSPESERWAMLGYSVACSNGMVVSKALNSDADDSVLVFTPSTPDQDHNGVPDMCLCPADFNTDGRLNFFDVQQFLNDFSSAKPGADFLPDGQFDLLDVQAFLNAYLAGCP